ncbi:MAG: MBOAT family O-acyltransferase [Eubacteriales bacterium]|nr:MBOAT family O-acyltransferase [Eubacteriales bacterium]
MLFSSILFLFYFLPITLALYYLMPKRNIQARNTVLLVASLLFYSWGEPVYIVLMIYSAFLNYYSALQIGRAHEKGKSGKGSMLFALVMNLLILGFFKYFGFLMDTFNSLTGMNIHYTALSLPIGISFYTFQALSYIFDVYRKNVGPQPSFLRFTLYLSLFPQLIAGPIVKYRDVEEQLSVRSTDWIDFAEGTKRFIFGLGKKVLLANNFGALYASIGALTGSDISVVTYWIGIGAYTLQIYFDFSGYSDMAIGLGRMFGFDFSENFRYPYISDSITEFWRRWHISLSTWFREYVYIPLGGNRVTVPRHILNLLIVWSLTGLWHGASWNFVLWGTYYGVLLIIEKYALKNYIEKWPKWVRHLYTMVIVMIGWTFFSITDFGAMKEYFAVMLGLSGHAFANMKTLYILRTSGILLAAGVWFSTPSSMDWFRNLQKSSRGEYTGILLLMLILILSIAYLVFGSYNPFLYFRF